LSLLAKLEEHAEKGVEILRSIVCSTQTVSLSNLIYIFTSFLPCKAPLSVLNPTYSESLFSSSLSLSSLLEKKKVVSKPNSKSEGKINAASQLDSQTTKQDYS